MGRQLIAVHGKNTYKCRSLDWMINATRINLLNTIFSIARYTQYTIRACYNMWPSRIEAINVILPYFEQMTYGIVYMTWWGWRTDSLQSINRALQPWLSCANQFMKNLVILLLEWRHCAKYTVAKLVRKSKSVQKGTTSLVSKQPRKK